MSTAALVLVTPMVTTPANASEEAADANRSESPWAVSIFAGPLTANNSTEIFLEQDWSTEAGMVGIALSRDLIGLGDPLRLEAEIQTVRRFAGQSLSEFTAIIIARWHPLPWDDLIESSFAVGYGPSHATEVPDSVRDGDEDISRTLGLLMVEFDFELGEPGGWSSLLRYQHRSAAFGLFGNEGAQDETTAFTLGLRYRF